MTSLRFAVALLLVLAACGRNDPAMRNLASVGRIDAPGDARTVASRYSVDAVEIRVPRALAVSEANTFYPMADIVWRGEPQGNRYDQIADIFAEAMEMGIFYMQTGPRVTATVELTRFHALTEKTRYTVGGVHSIQYQLTVRDARSGAVLDGPRTVRADVKASGGAQAIAEEEQGRTQRVVIVESLRQSILRELSVDPALAAAMPSTEQNPS